MFGSQMAQCRALSPRNTCCKQATDYNVGWAALATATVEFTTEQHMHVAASLPHNALSVTGLVSLAC